MAGVALLAASGLGPAGPVVAADLGGNCCADLEERIAELEATSARKGNRKVSLTLTGSVHAVVMLWDDGFERNAYVGGNSNDSVDQSSFKLLGEAAISRDLTAGFQITIRVNDSLTGEVSQLDDDGTSPRLTVWESYWFLASKQLGQISVGQASRASDGVPEADLSESAVAAFEGVHSIGGGFFLRRSDGVLSSLTWGDLYSHFNGDTANVVRYETPAFAGLTLTASYGEDDIWDVAANYEGEGGGFKIAGAIAYAEVTDETGLTGGGDVPNSTIVGSVAVLHEPSGLNALLAAGSRSFDRAAVDADGILRKPGDASYVYAKLGWLTKQLNGLGPTAFYGEWGRFQDFVSAGIDPAGVASLAVGGVQSCALAGVACRITGNEAEVWGLGVVQHIEAAEMQIFLGYRHHEADFDLVDGAGAAVGASGTESFETVVMGSKIAF